MQQQNPSKKNLGLPRWRPGANRARRQKRIALNKTHAEGFCVFDVRAGRGPNDWRRPSTDRGGPRSRQNSPENKCGKFDKNAALVGAKTVKGPDPCSVSTRAAAFTAAPTARPGTACQ